jgi:hypothetical protein
VIARPRRMLGLASTLWWGWSAWRRARRLFGPLRLP